jgi:hypothetical protein
MIKMLVGAERGQTWYEKFMLNDPKFAPTAREYYARDTEALLYVDDWKDCTFARPHFLIAEWRFCQIRRCMLRRQHDEANKLLEAYHNEYKAMKAEFPDIKEEDVDPTDIDFNWKNFNLLNDPKLMFTLKDAAEMLEMVFNVLRQRSADGHSGKEVMSCCGGTHFKLMNEFSLRLDGALPDKTSEHARLEFDVYRE